jgi:hypothetical protein
MPPRRSSATFTTLGVLNLVGGFGGLLVTLLSAIGLFAIYGGTAPPSASPLDSMAVQNHIRAVRPEYQFVELVDFGFGFLFDLMLIASGFGLLWRQRWARTVALIWAVMSFFKRFLMTGYTVLLVVPTMTAYYDATLARMNVPPAQASSAKVGAAIGGYGVGCGGGVLIAYPIVVFCLLMRRSAKAACEPRYRDEDDDDEDYDDRDGGRDRYRDDDRDGGRPGRDRPRYEDRDDHSRY